MEAYRDQIEVRIQEHIGSVVTTVEKRVTSLPDVVQNRWNVLSRRQSTSVLRSPDKQALKLVEAKGAEIAVIGMSGMFPKAENVEELWRNLVEGTDGVEELPAHYLDQEAFFSTKKHSRKTRCKWGGVLKNRDRFDPLFFNISPKEAESMNPHQRLVLQ